MKNLAFVLPLVICATSVHAQHAVESLSRSQVVGSMKCIHQTAAENDETDPRSWADGTYHLRYSTFRDPNEGYPGWHLVYIALVNPGGRSGWIYKVYVHRSKPIVDVGQYGTVKLRSNGHMEIDDVWGGLGTHDVISAHLKTIEAATALQVSSEETKASQFQCYDARHRPPE